MVSCSHPNQERFTSGLRDDLTGVWVYPSEQLGETTMLVVTGDMWQSYIYRPDAINVKDDLRDTGEILGQEGVYYFANPTNFYSPYFLMESPEQVKYFIINRTSYDSFLSDGQLSVQVLIYAGDVFDPDNPPMRPSIETLGVPFVNIFEDE